MESLKSTFIAAVALFVAACAEATDRHVAEGNLTPSYPYTNVLNAASNIQDAVNASVQNDVVLIHPGTYRASGVSSNGGGTGLYAFSGTSVVFVSFPVTLRGATGNRDDVIIDGGGANRGIGFFWQAQNTTNLFMIDSLTITNCYAPDYGGGICLAQDGLNTSVVVNCVIANNAAGVNGGGLYDYDANVGRPSVTTVSNCLIRNNQSPGAGGIYTRRPANGGAYYMGCTVMGNRGNGLYLSGGTQSMDRCSIDGNTHTNYGGGVFAQAVALEIRNCLIKNNHLSKVTGRGGAGVYVENTNANVSIVNCTIASNGITATATATAAGIWRQDGAVAVLNSIIQYNYRTNGVIANGGNSSIAFTNSCTTPTNGIDAFDLAGNITNDPRFASLAEQDFHLGPGSPCRNTGLDQLWMNGARDLDGKPRKFGTVDMGCYELFARGTTLILW